jgi:hypothetical protein
MKCNYFLLVFVQLDVKKFNIEHNVRYQESLAFGLCVSFGIINNLKTQCFGNCNYYFLLQTSFRIFYFQHCLFHLIYGLLTSPVLLLFLSLLLLLLVLQFGFDSQYAPGKIVLDARFTVFRNLVLRRDRFVHP